ncbi:MAG: Alginate exp protein [Gammaproteobacteria bacterium]|nr:Alginate exp protein [Gammaproteobacteria bacterium]
MINEISMPAVLFALCGGLWSVTTIAGEPWRVNSAAGLPGWLSVSGQHRTRYETLDNQFRNVRNGGDQALMFRTNILAEMRFAQVKFGVEMLDSRVQLADSGTPLSTNDVNPLDLLQVYADVAIDNLITAGSKGVLRGGRMTMDIGSRRFVARNSFRNAINAFTGVDWQWTGPAQNNFRAFYTLPVQRLVDGNPLDNEPELDRQHDEVRFWGVYYAPAKLPWGDKGEIYLLGLNEDDTPDLATSNRELYTAGVRIYRQPAAGQFDYQIESAFQFGESRASVAAMDITDLEHFAHFQHAEIGYTFAAQWSPQLLLLYDYASGDDSDTDGDNNGLDTLFGARRFDFGPTSIYGAFTRSNISTPGLRLNLKPVTDVGAAIVLRGFWLADDDDAWTTDVIPKNLQLEMGVACLFAGDFMTNAGKDDTTYFYSQLNLSF